MRVLLLVLLMLPAFTVPAYAGDIYEQAAGETGIYAMEEQLPQELREISGSLKVDGSYDTENALERLWKSFVDSAKGELGQVLKTACSLIAISMLCALSGSLCSGKPIKEYINIAGCCAAAVSLLGSLDSIVEQTVSALNQLSDYSKAALPAIFTAAAACGAVGSAPAKYAATCLALDVLMSISQKLIIPLVYSYLALAVAGSVFPNSLLSNTAKLTKWMAGTIMTAMTIAFSAYIGMTGLVTGSIDAAALKTARTVISTGLPVVGGIISDASGAVLSAASVIKNSAGVFGLIAVCAMCAGPFALLSVRMLVLKAAAAASDMAPNSRLSGLIASVSTAMGLLLGLLGCCGIMLFISITAGIKAVSL